MILVSHIHVNISQYTGFLLPVGLNLLKIGAKNYSVI